MIFKNKNSGFTIIEIIFVIAIIGVTATLGVSYMSKNAERSKEKATALQIQQILQAAMTYYVNNNAWPGIGSTVDARSAGTFASYIPAIDRLKTNPWGANSYTWVAQTSGGKLFTVSTVVPDNNTAARIASALPNATTSGTRVDSQITIPGQSQALPYGYIMKVGKIGPIPDNRGGANKISINQIVLTSSEATNCKGNITVMPAIGSFRMYGDHLGGLEVSQFKTEITSGKCGEFKRPHPDESENCGSYNTGYCLCYTQQGDREGPGNYNFLTPERIVVTYMVVCMPS